MRVARKHAAAVYCGVALASLEVEIAQVRGVAVRTSLLTKNKGKKMKKTIPTDKNKKTNPAPVKASAASEPAPAASPDQEDEEPKEETKIDLMKGVPANASDATIVKGVQDSRNAPVMQGMAGMLCVKQGLAQLPDLQGKIHDGALVKQLMATTKNYNEKFLGDKNWCDPWGKQLRKAGEVSSKPGTSWEVRPEPDLKAFSALLAKGKQPKGSKLNTPMFDVCCQEKPPDPQPEKNCLGC